MNTKQYVFKTLSSDISFIRICLSFICLYIIFEKCMNSDKNTCCFLYFLLFALSPVQNESMTHSKSHKLHMKLLSTLSLPKQTIKQSNIQIYTSAEN